MTTATPPHPCSVHNSQATLKKRWLQDHGKHNFPGSKLKTSKSFLQGKIGHVKTLFFWYCFQTFSAFQALKSWIQLLQYQPSLKWYGWRLLSPPPFFFENQEATSAYNWKNTKSEALSNSTHKLWGANRFLENYQKKLFKLSFFWIYSWLSLNTMKKTVWSTILNGICARSFRGLLTVRKLCVSPAGGRGFKDVRGTWPLRWGRDQKETVQVMPGPWTGLSALSFKW